MSHHDLPSGAWVELRDPKQVTERRRRPIQRKMAEIGITGGDRVLEGMQRGLSPAEAGMTTELADQFSDINDLLAIALVDSWSYGETVSVDSLLDLPGPDYDALRELVSPMVLELLPNFTADGVGDPKAPSPV